MSSYLGAKKEVIYSHWIAKKKKSFLQGYDKKETFTTRHSIDTNYQSARKLTKMTQLVKDKLGIFSEEKKNA